MNSKTGSLTSSNSFRVHKIRRAFSSVSLILYWLRNHSMRSFDAFAQHWLIDYIIMLYGTIRECRFVEIVIVIVRRIYIGVEIYFFVQSLLFWHTIQIFIRFNRFPIEFIINILRLLHYPPFHWSGTIRIHCTLQLCISVAIQSVWFNFSNWKC